MEGGQNSALTVAGDAIVKVSLQAYGSHAAAERAVEELTEYAALLDEQPVRVAGMRDVGVVEMASGYHVRHTYEFIDGPNLTKLPAAERQAAAARLLAQIAAMDTLDGHDVLAVPIDTHTKNIHVDQAGPALIDIFPALTRNVDGSFPNHAVGEGRGGMFPWSMGTKTGAMTTILSGTIDRGVTRQSKLAHLAFVRDDWCYDALPPNLDPYVSARLRGQIGAHFTPFMVRVARARLARVGR